MIDQGFWSEILRPGHAAELFSLVDETREHLQCWLPWVEHTREESDTVSYMPISSSSDFSRTNGRPWRLADDRPSRDPANLLAPGGIPRARRDAPAVAYSPST